jgi:excisionase family DNA binding protein
MPEMEGRDRAAPAAPIVGGSGLLDVAGAAVYLGVTEPFVRRLVLERRVRYFKLGKFVRFRTADLDAFVEAGRHEPVAPWVHTRSTLRRATTRNPVQQPGRGRPAAPSPRPAKNAHGR